MLADLEIGGQPRKVIMQASKNGFFYVIDRQTGQFISAKPFVKNVTWATGIDPKTIGDFEVSAEIVVRKGPMDDADPLAFEAHALSDLLVNQVSPPK